MFFKILHLKNITVLSVNELPSRIISVCSRNGLKILKLIFKEGKCLITVESKKQILFFNTFNQYNISYEVVQEDGFLFKTKKIFSRIGLMLGFAVGLIFIVLSSFYTFNLFVVDEKDNEIIEKTINQFLKDKPIILKENDIIKIKAELEKVNGVANANVYKDGMALYVQIQYELDDSVINYGEQSDIKSDFDAIVTRVVCLSGTEKAEKNQSVKKGDVLIQSKEEINGLMVDTDASGQVYGRVFYSDISYIQKHSVAERFTGKEFKYTVVEPFFSLQEKEIDVKSISPYENYYCEYSVCILKCILPLKIKCYIIKETEKTDYSADVKKELEAMVLLGKEKCLEQINGDYIFLNVNYKLTEEETRYVLNTYVEVERRIDTR